ncbi:MAG TPA: TatD family hydrolase, partial [Anaeromyxobacter sp.]
MPFIDSHAHLDFDDYAADLDAVVARARAAGVEAIVCVGLWRAPGSFGNALELAARDPSFFAATVGVHPHECARVPEDDWARHEALARDPRVVAIGETGLDFHYDHSPRPVQEASFRRSLAIARAAGKPVVVHVREADEV